MESASLALVKALPAHILKSAIGYSTTPVIDGNAEVATKDIPLNKSTITLARIYLPPTSTSVKLPTLIFFHGGGFILGSTKDENYNAFLSKLAAEANTLIVSVEYPLVSENQNRLPTAYDHCFQAIVWLHEQAKLSGGGEPWLAAHADFSKCFLGGDSAGANITHHMAMRMSSQSWEYLRLQGMILLNPFFGSTVPTGDEKDDPIMFFVQSLLWLLVLPQGSNADHPFSDPLSPDAPSLSHASLPRALVNVATEDSLRDRGVNYFQALKTAGKDATLFISEGEGHVFFLSAPPDSENARALLQKLQEFLNASL